MEKEYYKAIDLAQLLEVNIMTIYRYINDGKLNAYKIGKEFRIIKEDFDSFIESRKTKNTETEYIIVDDNNNWLSTCTTKESALKDYKELSKMSGLEYGEMEVGETLYLYEAKQLK